MAAENRHLLEEIKELKASHLTEMEKAVHASAGVSNPAVDRMRREELDTVLVENEALVSKCQDAEKELRQLMDEAL